MKILWMVLLFCMSTAMFAIPIEERIVFADSFRKNKFLYKPDKVILNGTRLVVTEDGVLCGTGHAAPILRLDPSAWDGSEGAISFCITPVDWQNGSHDKEFTLFFTMLKNHNQPEKGFKVGDTTLLLKMKRSNTAQPEQIILQGQNGLMDKHRAYVVMTTDKQFTFKPGKTTWVAVIWKNGSKASIYFDGKLAGSGEPYYFPSTNNLAYLSFLNGNALKGWGVLDGTAYFTDLAIVKGKTTIEELSLLRSHPGSRQAPPSTLGDSQAALNALPIIPFPAPLKKPALDGILDEYGFVQSGFLNDRTGLLSGFPARFYTAADAEKLYFGVDFEFKDRSYTPVSAAVKTDDPALIQYGDLAVLFLRDDRNAAAQDYSGEYITIAPNNSVYDAKEEIDWGKMRCVRNSGFSSGITSFSRFEKGRWLLEFSIPRKAVSNQKDFLFSFGLRIANQSYHLKSHTLWFDNIDAFLRGRITQKPLSFVFENPAAGKLSGQAETAGNFNAALYRTKAMTSIDAVVVDQVIGERTNYPPEKKLENWNGSSLKILRELPDKGLYLLSAEANSPEGVLYKRSVPFAVKGLVDITLRNNPVQNRLSVNMEFPGIPLRSGDRIDVSLKDKSGKTAASARESVKEDNSGLAELVLNTAGVSAGDYSLIAEVNGKAVAKTVFTKKPLPEWLTRPLGMEALSPNYAPPPWSPVQVKKEIVSVWGRDFFFGKGGLVSITSQNQTVLGKPMALEYRKGNQLFTLPLMTESVKSVGKGRAEAVVSGRDGNLRAKFTHTIEFDGLDWVQCSLEPVVPGTEFSEIFLNLHVENAPDFMNLYDYCSQQFGYTRDLDMMRMTAIWLGGENSGLNSLFENHKTLLIDSSKPRFSIRKGEKDSADYRIFLANAPAKFNGKIDWRFALHPTPFKPLYDKWEDERVFMMEWFAQPFNFICLHTHSHAANSTDFKPRNWKLGKALGELAKVHKQKLYPYTIATFISRESAIKPEAPFTRYRLPDEYFYKIGERPQSVDFLDFGDDWSFNPISTYPGDGVRHTEMIACSPASSWSDYAVYMQSKYLRECGFAGFYYDLTTTRENFDPARNYRYTTLDGKEEGTRELYATRNLLKRLYCEFSKIRGENIPYIFAHGYPILSSASAFWGVAIHGEEFKPRKVCGLSEMLLVDRQSGNPVMNAPPKDAKTDYSGVLWRIQYSPYRWGLPQIHLSQYAFNREWSRDPKTGREMLALCFPNNTLFDPSYAHWPTGDKFHKDVTMPFVMSSARFHGYWENQIKTSAPFIKVSYWEKKDGSRDYLVAVANWSDRDATAVIELPDFLRNAQFVYNMETVNTVGRWEEVEKNWSIRIPARDLKVFRFIGRKQ